ncbi:MAG TPA: prolyl oligopeptidase family serine peptidase [Bryobacteraceae bacterium]
MIRPLLFAAVAAACFAQSKLPDISYDPAAPLDYRGSLVKDYGDAQLLDVSYASPRGGRVTAYAVLPARPTHPAGIVWQHWGQGDRSSFLPEALALAHKGAASILINAPWLRPEAKPGPPGADLAQWLQTAVDIRRAVDVLLRQYGVQPARLAYVGHSYGATLGGVIAAGERRFHALVLMGGFASLSEGAKAPALAPIDAERYIAAASNPKEVHWYECGHELNDPDAVRDRAAFLDHQLGLSAFVAGVGRTSTSAVAQDAQLRPKRAARARPPYFAPPFRIWISPLLLVSFRSQPPPPIFPVAIAGPRSPLTVSSGSERTRPKEVRAATL